MLAWLAGMAVAACAASTDTASVTISSITTGAPLNALERVLKLEQEPDPKKLPELIEALRSRESVNARTEAARALGMPEYRKRYALEALSRAMLDDHSEEVRRRAAVSALQYEGHESVAAVQSALAAERADPLRRDLAEQLALAPQHLDDSEATEAVGQVCAEDPNADVRRAACDALGRRGDRRATEVLKRAADKDLDKSVRRAAKDALKEVVKDHKREAPRKALGSGRDR